MLHKLSKITTRLQPHQERALKRALVHNLILAHSTGSGKTLTSIAAADALGKPTTVLTPASLVENFKKELAKHKKGGPPVEVISLPLAVKRHYEIPEGNTLIIDEAHALRNSGTLRQRYVQEQAGRAGRILALTGTPAYNRIMDWASLANILARRNIIPADEQRFRDKYIRERYVYPEGWWLHPRGVKPGIVEELKNDDQLKKVLSPYVDVFDTDIEKPGRRDEYIHAPMSKQQLQAYKLVQKDMPASIRKKLLMNIPPDRAEAKSLNSFLTGVRQVSNTPEPFQLGADTGEKIKIAVQQLKDKMKENPAMRALVYSNFLDGGVNSYARQLDKAGIKYGLYTGAQTAKQKKDLVDAYNAGKLPVLLASGSGSEGLDLQGTRLIQLLEPHWNDSRIDQVIGRGIRYKSHEYLPKEQRNVLVQHYLSDLPDTGTLLKKKQTSVDNYLATRAKEKARLMQQVKDLFLEK